eukprot:6786223-Alexandrium_andersonii.AAC.1
MSGPGQGKSGSPAPRHAGSKPQDKAPWPLTRPDSGVDCRISARPGMPRSITRAAANAAVH